MGYTKQWYIRLDLKRQSDNKPINLNKDDTNIINISLVDEGKTINLSNINIVSVITLRPDDLNVVSYAEIIDPVAGKIKWTINPGTPDASVAEILGTCRSTIELYEGDAKYSSTEFVFNAVEGLLDDDDIVTTTPQYPILNQLLSDMGAKDATYTANEATRESREVIRIANEEERQNTENERINKEASRDLLQSQMINLKEDIESSELIRISNENARNSNENTRQIIENTRNNSELTRKSNEVNRINQEQARINAELIRIEQENIRISQETLRQELYNSMGILNTAAEAQENQRKNNELTRISQETQRQTQEITREEAETSRSSIFTTNETTRQSTFETSEQNRDNAFSANESTRNNQESIRQTNEGTRIANEQTRVINESNRNTIFSQKVTEADEATFEAYYAASFAYKQPLNTKMDYDETSLVSKITKTYSDFTETLEILLRDEQTKLATRIKETKNESGTLKTYIHEILYKMIIDKEAKAVISSIKTTEI